MIVQILTREGAERWGEQTFGYTGGDERLTINWIKVVRPDGTVISDKPTHEQESLAPVALEAPVYSDAKVRRVSIGGVAPGTLLSPELLLHELRHVHQFLESRTFPFSYLWQSIRYGYFRNAYEADARRYAAHRLAQLTAEKEL